MSNRRGKQGEAHTAYAFIVGRGELSVQIRRRRLGSGGQGCTSHKNERCVRFILYVASHIY